LGRRRRGGPRGGVEAELARGCSTRPRAATELLEGFEELAAAGEQSAEARSFARRAGRLSVLVAHELAGRALHGRAHLARVASSASEELEFPGAFAEPGEDIRHEELVDLIERTSASRRWGRVKPSSVCEKIQVIERRRSSARTVAPPEAKRLTLST